MKKNFLSLLCAVTFFTPFTSNVSAAEEAVFNTRAASVLTVSGVFYANSISPWHSENVTSSPVNVLYTDGGEALPTTVKFDWSTDDSTTTFKLVLGVDGSNISEPLLELNGSNEFVFKSNGTKSFTLSSPNPTVTINIAGLLYNTEDATTPSISFTANDIKTLATITGVEYRGSKVALIGPGGREQLVDFSLDGVSDAHLKTLMHMLAGLSSKKVTYTQTPTDAVTLQITVN